jgi:DNA-binding NarL/FixJ family response regulator
MSTLRLAIVDDHGLLAESLAWALNRQDFETTIVTPTTETEVLVRLREVQPDVVLLDLHLGPIGNAVPLIEPLIEWGARVIVMTGETSRAAWGECVEAGAAAVVTKTAPFDVLLDRIARLASGSDALDRTERLELLEALRVARQHERVRLDPFRHLSARESEVLYDLMQGKNAETIAESSFVSVTTVRTHIRSILRKLDVSSQLAAVAMATRAGWKPLEEVASAG